MTPLRVLVVASWYPSADNPTAGVFIREQVRAIAPLADVAVLYVHDSVDGSTAELSEEDGARVVRARLQMPPMATGVPGRIRAVVTNLHNRFFGYRRLGRAAYEALRHSWGAPDIVHVQALWPAGLIARDLKRRHGIPFVITEHSEEYSAASERRLVKTPGMLPLVLRPLARAASKTIAVSRFLGDRLVELGLARGPAIIPNVVPYAPPTPLPSAHPQVILHVSIMGPAKDISGLLDAVDALRGRRSDFVLLLVGDGELRKDLEAKALSLGLNGAAQFVGSKSPEEIRALRAESAFTVISSTHETFSVVAAESLMAGRPVVSTRCGGPEEFITPDVGLLVDAGDPDTLADGLDWMLDHSAEFDPALLHAYAAERFAPDVVAQRILSVYREVLDA
ncbi:MAG: glycosyltransferase [Coriobacteriia bacterium]